MRSLAAIALLLAGCGCGDEKKKRRTPAEDAGDGNDGGPGDDGGGGACRGETLIECPDAVSAACTGPATDVAVGEANVCSELQAATSDAPAGGFPVGETTVTFETEGPDGEPARCTTTVTVTDDEPPVFDCPAEVILVRTAPGEVLVPTSPAATDLCDAAPEVTTPGDPLPTGTTRIESRATDDAGNEAVCATDFRVLDVFAPESPRIASGERRGDATTAITLAWERSGGDATGYQVERADDPDGAWASIASLALADQFHTDAPMPDDHAWYRIRAMAGELEGGVTAALHAYEIEETSYDLRGQAVPTVPFATTLYGVVRHPDDLTAGPYPLVLLLHGNHGNCRPPGGGDDECSTNQDHECPWGGGYTTTPNAEGLTYLAETLAAQGYVAATLSGNALNCRDDYVGQRAQLLIENLRRWKGWNDAAGAPFDDAFVGRIDMDRVGLVGHSRGGEAVAHVPGLLDAAPIAGVTVESVFSIAPIDFHRRTVTDAAFAVLLPGCDGDVYTLEGMRIYDRSVDPGVELPRSQGFIDGANHNFFSTEWLYSDNAGFWLCPAAAEIGDDAQQAMLETTLSSWFAATLGEAGIEAFERADADTPTGIDAWAGEDLDLRWSHAAAERMPIDDFEGAGSPGVNRLGAANSFSEFTDAIRCTGLGCDDSFFHEKTAVLLRWEDRTPVASWGLGSLDATAWTVLSFRVVSRISSLNVGITEQEFTIRVLDDDGDLVELALSDVQPIQHLYSANFHWEVLQTVRIPLEDLTAENPALDLAALDAFELEMTTPGHLDGSVIVTDLELAR